MVDSATKESCASTPTQRFIVFRFFAPAGFQIQKELHAIRRTLTDDVIHQELSACHGQAVEARRRAAKVIVRHVSEQLDVDIGLRGASAITVSSKSRASAASIASAIAAASSGCPLEYRTSVGPMLVRYLRSSIVLRCFGVGR